MKATINANGNEIAVLSDGKNEDFISLTDIAKFKSDEFPGYIIQNWLRNRNTVEFLGLWERINNPNFNCIEFEAIEAEAGKNSFVLTPKKWVESVKAKGMFTKQGRYAATFAHKDIAFKFASWISAEFELYVIKDYQRLKQDENSRLSLGWNLNRELSKINYKIHTDAIKNHLIPENIEGKVQAFTYANEADILNVALFGKTAKMWRDENESLDGNTRDHATYQQLIVLSNMESMNAELIKLCISQSERVIRLNKMAIEQLSALMNDTNVKRLEKL